MSTKIKYILLTVILLIGLVLRLWQLGAVPISPDWDEAALGYDAYSIMHTGRDEFGAFMPAVLRSFDDYKPALYAYLAIPSVAIFGLTTFAVRFPSVVFGLIGILALYFLIKELFVIRGNTQNYAEILALTAAFVMAISPWSLQFSRTAFETSTGLTFNLLVALFFLKGLKRPRMLLLAALFAGLDLSVYQSERVFTPFLVLALVIIYRKELFAVSKKYLVWSVVIGLIAILPMLSFIITTPDSLQRIQGTSLFSQQSQALQDAPKRLAFDINNNDPIGQLIDNRRLVYGKEVLSAYLVHFDPNWLFIEGDNPRHHAPGMGLLYLVDLPFLFIGIYLLCFVQFEKKTKYLVLSWLFLAPIPAAVTFEVPHAVRTMNMLPMLLLFIAVGYVGSFQFFKKCTIKYKALAYGAVVVFAILALFNFVYYLNQYFVQQNYFNAYDWQYGYAQAIPQIEKIKGNYTSIVVSNKTPMDDSYMFFLFYLKYPPQQYQALVAQGKNTTGQDHQFDKYDFRSFDWNTEKIKKNTLFVGIPSDFPGNIKAMQTITYPDGKTAMLLVDPKDNL